MKVLYIAGAGRSGSTLLEMILGNLPGFFSVGEVRFFWQYLEAGNWLCGCGKLLRRCEFWSAVVERLEADAGFDLATIASLAHKHDRTRNLPWLTVPFDNGRKPPPLYISAVEELYRGIAGESQGSIIVDSSKVPSHLYMLQQIPSFDVRVLHLVRDGRAVAYSWSKRKKRELGSKSDDDHMPVHSSLRAIITWMVENYYVRKIGRRSEHYAVIRYEDFVSEPARVLQGSLRRLGMADVSLEHLERESIAVNSTHSVSGNPLRLGANEITIRPDTEWQRTMNSTKRFLLGLLAYGELRHFGYTLRG